MVAWNEHKQYTFLRVANSLALQRLRRILKRVYRLNFVYRDPIDFNELTSSGLFRRSSLSSSLMSAMIPSSVESIVIESLKKKVRRRSAKSSPKRKKPEGQRFPRTIQIFRFTLGPSHSLYFTFGSFLGVSVWAHISSTSNEKMSSGDATESVNAVVESGDKKQAMEGHSKPVDSVDSKKIIVRAVKGTVKWFSLRDRKLFVLLSWRLN